MAKLSLFPSGQVLDDNGNPLSLGTVEFYEAGTSTPKTAYTSQDESVALSNPASIDSTGRIEIWLGDGAYRIVVKDSLGNTVDERDNVVGDSSSSFLSDPQDVSANTLINSTYQNTLISATGTISLSLIPAASAGEGFSFAVYNEGSGTVTIDPDGSETINTSSTLELLAGEWAIISCDGSEWKALEYEASSPTFKVSSNDTTAGFLEDKLIGGTAVTFSTQNDGSNETRTINLSLANQAQAEAGTNATVLMTPLRVADAITALIRTEDNIAWSFTSTGQTITAGGTLTIAHGLGYVPTKFAHYIQCTSADGGYSVGEKAYRFSDYSSTVNEISGFFLQADATNIYVRFGTRSTWPVPDWSDGTLHNITLSNWDLYIQAE